MIREVMESASLTLWPVLSLLIFTSSTAVMTAWIFRRGSRRHYDRMGNLPLEEGRAAEGAK